MDKVFIKNLKVQGIIGVYSWEREILQEILINLVLYTDTREAAEHDEVTESVDYGIVAEKVKSLAETAGRLTVEALASDIAQLCLQEANVLRVSVRVEKPGAVSTDGSAGVEIERSLDDFLQ
jgi:FolB domain-containing protein